LESNRIRDKRRRAQKKCTEVEGWRRGGGWGGTECLTNPVAWLLQLFLGENIPVVLGEELVGPHVEGHFLDPKVALGSDKDPGNRDAGLLTLNALPVGFSIGSSMVVSKVMKVRFHP